jgi:hypothetical protein
LRIARNQHLDREGPPYEGRIIRSGNRRSNSHSRFVSRLDTTEFGHSIEADVEACRRVRTQHPAMNPGMETARNVDRETPVLLHRAARKQRSIGDRNPIGTDLSCEPWLESVEVRPIQRRAH